MDPFFSPTQRRFWGQMQLLLAQFDGLLKGYNDHAPEDKVRTSPPLALREIWFLLSEEIPAF
jgi:hypothetical protein